MKIGCKMRNPSAGKSDKREKRQKQEGQGKEEKRENGKKRIRK
jgi:hypothetical protein